MIESEAARTLPAESPQGVEEIAEDDFVLVIVDGSFETLKLPPHPAESRIRKLARETPAQLIAFDLLAQRAAPTLAEVPSAWGSDP